MNLHIVKGAQCDKTQSRELQQFGEGMRTMEGR